PRYATNVQRVQHAGELDAIWGVSALVLIMTGIVRAFGGFEKGGDYYLHAPLFHLKMGALALILVLELVPPNSLRS
ncbi:DUF2214 family protein, partial [Burkholderia mallei]|uniref:DUF2214 family protein n=1 Tax=Burkholderia mallei TaxID=13373 RepID=UPI00006DD1FD